jgi:flagellar biosynthetic protein FlhB
MLYKFGAVGKPIPVNLYRAVAEILAFVYKTHKEYFKDLRRRRSGV